LEGGGLRVRFAFCGDRYAHEVWLADGATWVKVLSSVEGSPSEPWPASPALQSLHLECGQEGHPTALLVGMAGKSHYSLSASLDRVAKCVRFDVACRAGGERIGSLGSRYRVWHGDWNHDQRHATFAPLPSSAACLELEICQHLGSARIESVDDTIAVVAEPSLQSLPQTVRWGYTVVRHDRSTTA
jgi:hypothetical protein